MKKNLLFAGFLSLVFSLSQAQTSDKEVQARTWIRDNVKELNSNSELSLRFVRKSLSGETLRFQQMMNGVPVFDTELVIHFSSSGEITHTDLNFDNQITPISTTPQISKENAIAISDKEIGVAGMVTFQENKLFVYNELASTKLVYRVVTSFEEKPGSWEVIIDANSGEVLGVKDISIHCNFNGEEVAHNIKTSTSNKEKFFMPVEKKSTLAFEAGSAMVFLADPLSSAHVAYNTAGYTDGDDSDTPQLNAQRVNVVLPQVDNTAGTYKLKSSYVEIKDLEAPSNGLFTQSTPNFAFTRNQDGFEAANIFYHTDNSLRYINQTLGIQCVQNVDNSHAGVLWYDPSGWNGEDQSSYSNGSLSFGEGCVDDGEDGDVIWHELGHGIHDWITGGSLSRRNGLSEGSGDYWAQSHSRILNHWTTSDPAYHWMFNWDGHNVCWGGRTTNYGAVYPGGLTGPLNSNTSGIHTDGQIWSTSLMKIWDVIGREKTDKAFLEGLSMTNSSTNQQGAAIAVRQAAIDMNYSCADIKVFTEKFTQTGYVLPAIALRINCPGNQTVVAGAGNTYTLPSYLSLTNAINTNCDAVVTQNPVQGTVVAPGMYTVTMTATSGSSVNCNFTLTVQPSLSVDEFVKKNLKLYPNPASTEITISGDFISGQEIEIFNLLGQKLIQKNLETNEEKVDISNLSSGVYTAKFKGSNTTLKFVKN